MFINLLLFLRKIPLINLLAYYAFKFLGVEIPLSVKIGKNFRLEHWGSGVVIHPLTQIGNNVKIYQGVTIGRGDIYKTADSSFTKIEIGDNVILSAGSKVLVYNNCRIDNNVILGANSVLIVKVPEVESGIYVGIPAKKIKDINQAL